MNQRYPEVDDILNSLDGIQKSEAPAFFTTRVLARYDKLSTTDWGGFLFHKPVFTLTTLVILLVVNITFLKQSPNSNSIQQENASLSNSIQKPDLQSFAGEYNLQSQISSY